MHNTDEHPEIVTTADLAEYQFVSDLVHWSDDLMRLLEQTTITAWPDEDRLQQHLSETLAAAGVEHHREYRLDAASRLDIFIPTRAVPAKPLLRAKGIAVEVKIKGSAADALRQLERYAHHDDVLDLVLVTTVASHRGMPTTLNYKPLRVFPILEGGL